MLSKKLTIDKIPHLVKDKRVLVRVDFNVPLQGGIVADPTRISSSLATIEFLQEHGAKQIILMSHLGRPKGVRNTDFSLSPTVPVLEDLLSHKVKLLDDCVGQSVETEISTGNTGDIFMLENLRFHLEEEGKGVVNGEKVKADAADVTAFRK